MLEIGKTTSLMDRESLSSMEELNTTENGARAKGKARESSAQKTIQSTMATGGLTKGTASVNTKTAIASPTKVITNEAKDVDKVPSTSAMETNSLENSRIISNRMESTPLQVAIPTLVSLMKTEK